VVRGAVGIDGVRLAAGDGAGIEDQPEIMIEADEDAEILLFDLG
jgi:redox-sensitive bicupin YhaK (pirin superfamily)